MLQCNYKWAGVYQYNRICLTKYNRSTSEAAVIPKKKSDLLSLVIEGEIFHHVYMKPWNRIIWLFITKVRRILVLCWYFHEHCAHSKLCHLFLCTDISNESWRKHSAKYICIICSFLGSSNIFFLCVRFVFFVSLQLLELRVESDVKHNFKGYV